MLAWVWGCQAEVVCVFSQVARSPKQRGEQISVGSPL